jgi:hypothetical protein
MNITDEELMAYADGELDEGTRSRIEAALEQDPALRARVNAHRQMRTQLHDAYAPILDERIPDRLTATINAPVRESAVVTHLDQRREKRAGKIGQKWSWAQWGAIAASLVLGVFIGRGAMESEDATVFARSGEIVATGVLAEALDRNISDESGAYRIALSFRSSSGEYCRAFVGQEDPLAGLACHIDDTWRIRALNETEAQSTEYERASSQLPAAILTAIDQTMAGEPLTTDEEEAARARGWNHVQ